MRTLTTTELESETLHRVALRLRRQPSAVDRDLVRLIAEMIALSQERVPSCYVQAAGTPRASCERCGRYCGDDC